MAKGVKLKKHGENLLGLCPFHDDREPSLVITPEKNLWHCLGACQTGGTVIDWVMRAEGVRFRHAVELLREGLPSSACFSGEAPRSAERAISEEDDVLSLTQNQRVGFEIYRDGGMWFSRNEGHGSRSTRGGRKRDGPRSRPVSGNSER